MKVTLSDNLHKCLKAFTDMEREDWLFVFPAQCTLIVEQIVWTHNVFAALEAIEDGEDRNALNEYREFFLEQLNMMVDLVKRDLTPLQVYIYSFFLSFLLSSCIILLFPF